MEEEVGIGESQLIFTLNDMYRIRTSLGGYESNVIEKLQD